MKVAENNDCQRHVNDNGELIWEALIEKQNENPIRCVRIFTKLA